MLLKIRLHFECGVNFGVIVRFNRFLIFVFGAIVHVITLKMIFMLLIECFIRAIECVFVGVRFICFL